MPGASRRIPSPQVNSGRRGYYRYLYGTHYWTPETLADFSKGMVRDTARVAIPEGSVYDSADYLLHQPGVAQKRGGTAYAGPALTGASYAIQVAHVPFNGGSQLLAVGSNGHLFKVTAGTTTDIGALGSTDYTKIITSPGATYALFAHPGVASQKYDGTTISSLDGGNGHYHFATYKARVVGTRPPVATWNRMAFSPTPDVNATWDLTNSYIDADNEITGFAALNNALLIFSMNGIERIIGATPPPNSDMDRAPLAPGSTIGCTDTRSITVAEGLVFFANPNGVYMTNGGKPDSITDQGGISTYWRSLFSGYVAAAPAPTSGTWTIATGFWRGFLFVTVLDNSRNLIDGFICYVPRRAWMRVKNIKAMAYATSADGNELYYANADTNRVTAMSGIFSPAAGNKNDADGTAVAPTIEFRPVGNGTGIKSYGFGHLDMDMRDAASDNPTMAVTIKAGIEADTVETAVESPFAETTTVDRLQRFSISRDAQAVTVALAQTGASSKTEIYALEVETRQQSLTGEGVS